MPDSNESAMVLEQRKAIYGDIFFGLTQTAKVWEAMLTKHNQKPVKLPPELAGFMLGVEKVMRACHTPGGHIPDHQVDWTNYLDTGDKLQCERFAEQDKNDDKKPPSNVGNLDSPPTRDVVHRVASESTREADDGRSGGSFSSQQRPEF